MSDENALEKAPETGLSQEQREKMLEDDSLGYIKPVHGIMIANLNMAGVTGVQPGDYVLNGACRIPAGMQGTGFRAAILGDRPRAVIFEGSNVVEDTHDPFSKEWADIASKVAGFVNKDDRGNKISCKVGAEMLLWLCDLNVLAVAGVFNKERQTLYPKLLGAMKAKTLVQFTTGMRPSKNGPVVFQVANVIEGVTDAPKYALDPERAAKAIKVFEAYKQEKKAPAGPRR